MPKVSPHHGLLTDRHGLAAAVHNFGRSRDITVTEGNKICINRSKRSSREDLLHPNPGSCSRSRAFQCDQRRFSSTPPLGSKYSVCSIEGVLKHWTSRSSRAGLEEPTSLVFGGMPQGRSERGTSNRMAWVFRTVQWRY